MVRTPGCGTDAGLWCRCQAATGLNALALGWALHGGSAVVVAIKDPALYGTSSVPGSRERELTVKISSECFGCLKA